MMLRFALILIILLSGSLFYFPLNVLGFVNLFIPNENSSQIFTETINLNDYLNKQTESITFPSNQSNNMTSKDTKDLDNIVKESTSSNQSNNMTSKDTKNSKDEKFLQTNTPIQSLSSSDAILCPPFTCIGTDEDDEMIGTTVGDTMYGLDGDDLIQGNSLNDVIYGGDGDDVISGGEGTDTLFGGDGDDVLFADSGTNFIFGGGGSYLYGEKGDDYLYGGTDNDVLTGGKGKDFFDCNEGQDVVTDFDPKEDTINSNCEVVLKH